MSFISLLDYTHMTVYDYIDERKVTLQDMRSIIKMIIQYNSLSFLLHYWLFFYFLAPPPPIDKFLFPSGVTTSCLLIT